jgi:hypothetical protein
MGCTGTMSMGCTGTMKMGGGEIVRRLLTFARPRTPAHPGARQLEDHA